MLVLVQAPEDLDDLRLLDANLHGRSVNDIAAALTRRAIPFVFVTGYGRDTLPAMFSGTPVLEKPFFSEQLLELVGRLVTSGAEIVPLRQRN